MVEAAEEVSEEGLNEIGAVLAANEVEGVGSIVECWCWRVDIAVGEGSEDCVRGWCRRGWGRSSDDDDDDGGRLLLSLVVEVAPGKISLIEGCLWWSSILGAEGREEERRLDIHRELRVDRDGMEDEDDERAIRAAPDDGDDGSLVSAVSVLMMVGVGCVDADRGGGGWGRGRGGEREANGKVGDRDGVANGLVGFGFGGCCWAGW